MKHLSRSEPTYVSPFADFIRNASAAEKEKVYKEVLERATQRQLSILAKAKQAST
jgi:hypothetical protein